MKTSFRWPKCSVDRLSNVAGNGLIVMFYDILLVTYRRQVISHHSYYIISNVVNFLPEHVSNSLIFALRNIGTVDAERLQKTWLFWSLSSTLQQRTFLQSDIFNARSLV